MGPYSKLFEFSQICFLFCLLSDRGVRCNETGLVSSLAIRPLSSVLEQDYFAEVYSAVCQYQRDQGPLSTFRSDITQSHCALQEIQDENNLDSYSSCGTCRHTCGILQICIAPSHQKYLLCCGSRALLIDILSLHCPHPHWHILLYLNNRLTKAQSVLEAPKVICESVQLFIHMGFISSLKESELVLSQKSVHLETVFNMFQRLVKPLLEQVDKVVS